MEEVGAVREGRWKLIRSKGHPAELYDVEADIGKSHDLTAREPEVTRRLPTRSMPGTKKLIPPVFLGSSVKNEDWGPGGQSEGKP